MRNLLIGLLLTLIATLPAVADTLRLRDDVPERYVVVEGDTLWDIATTFLEDPWRWEDIWYQNPQIDNPDLIFPGDVLALRFVEGEPQLVLEVRDGEVIDGDPEEVRLSPRVRVEGVDAAIPTLPRSQIASFLNNNLIVGEQTFLNAPYVVGGEEGRLLLGEGHRVFARGDWADEGSQYEVFRRGERFENDDGELLGVEAIAVANAKLELVQDDIARLKLTRSSENVRVSDRLALTRRDSPSPNYFPSAPPSDLDGRILNVADGGQFIGRFDVVLLSRGREDGVTEGHLFDVTSIGDVIRDPITNEQLQLPGQRNGTVMVFRTFDRLSYALVMDSINTIAVGDRIIAPESDRLP